MTLDWQTSWEKEGSTLSGVTTLRKGAWTSYYKATETVNGKATDVVIKTFGVPEDIVSDPERIAVEREKFLAAARLQKEIGDGNSPGGRAWVKVLRLSEDAKYPSFSMEKCGPSARDLRDNRAQLSAKDLYELVQSILLGLMELKGKKNRSHGNIKLSDVLCARPGQSPAYKLADPAAKGEDHSANDLYALGLVVYELIEQREYDPLNPLIPTRPWQRFGGKRDKWIQFCNMLLNPNGCHEPLPEVKKLSLRLKPSSPMKYVALATVALLILGGASVGVYFLSAKMGWLDKLRGGGTVVINNTTNPQGNPGGNSGPNTNTTVQVPAVDPEVRGLFDGARQAYLDAYAKWNATGSTSRYDHAKSAALLKQARDLVPDQLNLTSTQSFKEAAERYKSAEARLLQAIEQLNTEEEAGSTQDSALTSDLDKARTEFLTAKGKWEAAAAKFQQAHDHTRSTTLARAANPPLTPPTDIAAFPAAVTAYRSATAQLNEALGLAEQEDLAGMTNDQAKQAFEEARKKYTALREQWVVLREQKDIDLTDARAAADEARKMLPSEIVLTDANSYRSHAEMFRKAGKRLEDAVELATKAKMQTGQRQSEISTAVSDANKALQERRYSDALTQYQKAADLGNPPAMRQVGLLYETGNGGGRDYGQAMKWYLRAAEAGYPPAMYDAALMYEAGRGTDQDSAKAAQWLKKAAEAKYGSAINRLGSLYEQGRGVDQSYAEAMKWYRAAAELNDATAMCNVGVLYEQGRGVKADPVEAAKWYRRAADLGSAPAMYSLGALYDAGRGMKVDYAAAMEWYTKAAEKGYAPAMSNIGVLYDNGLGVKANPTEAVKWFQKAAELNHGMAMFNTGFMYERGRGVKADVVQAVNWYRRAYKSDDTEARDEAEKALRRMGYSPESTPKPLPPR